MNHPATQIPLVDLRAQLATIEDEVRQAMDRVLARTDFILGEELTRFEAEFGAFCGVEHAIGCASGTDALHLAFRAFDIGPGDEVVMPAFTFAATALGVVLAGARPILVDVEAETGLLDPELLDAAIGPRTKAVLPVHLYGQCADMSAILEIARARRVLVVEDAAQAHGAWCEAGRAGAIGDIGCFSFYPGKNLGAYGDGGLVTTRDSDLAEKLRLLGNWGSRRKYHHEEAGMNSRLDTLQAAILRVKLARLDDWNQRRRAHATAYSEALSNLVGVELTRAGAGSVHHLFVIRLAERDRVLARLHEAGIQAGIHYPFALHELGAYSDLGYQSGDFPVSEDWARRCLSLPIYAELPADAVDRCHAVLSATVHREAS